MNLAIGQSGIVWNGEASTVRPVAGRMIMGKHLIPVARRKDSELQFGNGREVNLASEIRRENHPE